MKKLAAPVPQISLQQIKTDFKGEYCYVHARGAMDPEGMALITTQPLRLKGDDDFRGLEMLKSTDGGKNWSEISKCPALVREDYGSDCERVMCDSTPFYHRKSGQFILIGHSAVYPKKDRQSRDPLPRHTLWSVFDPQTGNWRKYNELKMPGDDLFFNCGSGCAQIVELPEGDLLVPVYGVSKKELLHPPVCYKSLVLRCRFDGSELKVMEIGSPLSVTCPRGLGEPSVVAHKDKFFLALRNDQKGYVCRSDDGLEYTGLRVLAFDDGQESGNYCTQQHWITGGGKLYLVYTRRDAGNDHVFRHRAPLFIAEFDPEKLCLIRSTEKVAVPERGARLGNFGCTRISDDESWIIAAEWMQTRGPDYFNYKRCMEYGSDNSIWIAKVKFRSE